MIAVTLVVLVFLYVFFRYTPRRPAMRAAAGNPQSARLVGIRVGWMIALGWGMAAAIGAIAGMLIAPVVFLEPNMMLGILLYGFAAAVRRRADEPRRRGPRRLFGRHPREPRRDLRALRRQRAEAADRARHHRAVLVVRPGGLFGRVHVQRV